MTRPEAMAFAVVVICITVVIIVRMVLKHWEKP